MTFSPRQIFPQQAAAQCKFGRNEFSGHFRQLAHVLRVNAGQCPTPSHGVQRADGGLWQTARQRENEDKRQNIAFSLGACW